jgi:hypothetical protein
MRTPLLALIGHPLRLGRHEVVERIAAHVDEPMRPQ